MLHEGNRVLSSGTYSRARPACLRRASCKLWMHEAGRHRWPQRAMRVLCMVQAAVILPESLAGRCKMSAR